MAIEEENSLVLDRPAKISKRNNDESGAKIIAASYLILFSMTYRY